MSIAPTSQPTSSADEAPLIAGSIVVLGGLDRDAICEILATRLPQLNPVSADDLPAALAQDGAVLVVMPAPEDSLATCLAEADDAAGAFAGWIAAWRDLLALQRRNRRRMTLIDVAMLTRDSDAAWPVLARRLGTAEVQPGPRLAPAESGQALFRLAAATLCLRNAEAAEVVAELDAVTVGGGQGDMAGMVFDVVGSCGKSGDEVALLRENLTAQLDQHERAARDGEAERERAAELEARLQALTKAHEEAVRARAEAEDAQALLRENLTAQLDQHERTARDGEAEYAKVADLEAGLQALTEAHEEAVRARAEAEDAQALLRENLTAQLDQYERAARDGEAEHAKVTDLETRLQALTEAHEEAVRARAEAEDAQALLRENLTAQLDQHERAARDGEAERERAAELEARLQALTKAHEAAETDASRRISLLEENISLQIEAADDRAGQHARDMAAMTKKHATALQEARLDVAQARQMVQAEKTAREGQARRARETRLRRDAVLGAQLLTEARTIAELERGLEAATAETARLQEKLAETAGTLDEQHTVIDALSRELDKVYGSRSWRVTGPLRATMSRFGSHRAE